MVEATTPDQNQEENATSPESQEAITSDKPKEEEEQTSSKKVAELQSEVDRLKQQLTQQQTLQGQADKKSRQAELEKRKLEKQIERIKKGETFIPEEAPTENQQEQEVKTQARIGIQNLLLDNPDYQELLKQDVTLKEVLRKNPLSLLDEYVDSEDAVEQMKEKLDQRVSSVKSQTQPKPGETKKEEAPKFGAGAVEPSGESETPPKEEEEYQTPDEKVEKNILKRLKFGG